MSAFGVDIVSVYPGGVNTRLAERTEGAKVSKLFGMKR